MLLQSLYGFAQNQKLFYNLPLQKRDVHVLIAIDGQGNLRSNTLIPLTQQDAKGKEHLGQEHLMPRFPGENNGGKAYFLAESSIAVLGRDKISGECISVDPKKGKNATKAFLHFWKQIQEGYSETKDFRLKALLEFRAKQIREVDGKIQTDLPFLKIEKNRKDEPELYGDVGTKKPVLVKKLTIAFSVDGQPLTLDNENDSLREYWFQKYAEGAFVDDKDGNEEQSGDFEIKPTMCLVTGETGIPIARSHKPKILGIPGLSSGGYLVSFAKEAPAFSSYGFEMGQNAPVCERVAASYALALNKILDDSDTHLNLGPLSVCFWARYNQKTSGLFNSLLNKAHPEQVKDFLTAPFSGISDREILRKEKLYTVAFKGNAGRVAVQYWLEQPLEVAQENFAQWWDHLQIISLYKQTNNAPPIYAIPVLARTTLRRTKEHKDDKLLGERIICLYQAALEKGRLPITLLKPILSEFHSALVKDDENNPLYPFSASRFALIKLILLRNPNRKEDDFMPTYELADTPDPAYNLGRLLSVFENLQDRYHNYERKGAGIVERYYGTASSAPASAFPLLCRLARHHLSKLKKGEKKDKAAAYAIEKNIADICSKFQPTVSGQPPVFPRILTLEDQGKFALGFYQQKAEPRRQATGQGVENNLNNSEEV
ncbi:MAG: type I-C CRISPR-associated protein Cas8c/Csd1 [Candidatus Brocadia carolinensis]|uniref:Type I-C CRISPR-associated protein Cas8c/Csd1 n=1 Tax=Candidatus Brocadia carolinensis TaxID=1004156 RepID=A0A1V4ARH2_9BACT|nr:MAG: type I-C CRISPR-associated protein Cas8c/Csd1 [Candidatus Brocadia caroliniensis]